ncbi:NAD(P)-binding protein, partial [Pleomassaria siparia CBS 279.74]
QAILIVGGGQGIGLHTTRAILSSTPSTTRIVIFGLHADPSLASLSDLHPGRLLAILGNVTSASDRQKAVDTCVQKLGGVDTLVYCAGVITPIERIDKVDVSAVERTYAVNVFGAIVMTQLCLPHLRRSSFSNPTNAARGKVIILSSACDSTVTYMGWMAYCTSKAALTRFVQLLAHEERTLSVQGVFPKLTRTAMAKDLIEAKYKDVMADHEIERFRVWDAIGDAMVEPPEWCADAVAELATGRWAGLASGSVGNYDLHVP